MAVMRKFVSPWCLVAALLVVMAALMLGPLREESATVDEALYVATSYLYSMGHGHGFNPEHPPLALMASGVPLWWLDVNVPEFLKQLADLRLGAPRARPWKGWQSGKAEEIYPGGRSSWYYWPYWEAGIFGQELVYGGWNDAEVLLWAGRSAQVMLTLLTGLVIALWLRKQAGMEAAVLGTALWVFNPIALAYGHLVLTDMGVALGMTLAVWAFSVFLEKPSWRTALLAGTATGVALAMKFSAVLLAPIYVALILLFFWTRRETGGFWKWLPLVAVGAWAVVMVVYAPHWKPAPALSAVDAAKIGVPGWFQKLRLVLIPSGFFKGIAMQAEHAKFGHEAFLCGEWRMKGWWQYFPLAWFWKTPIAFLVMALAAFSLWAARVRRWSFAEATPWMAALAYMGMAMTSTINIGVRYLLPVVAFAVVGTAAQWARLQRGWRIGAWLLCGWLAVTTLVAYPFYIEYFNEFAGGTRNGYECLVDSNYDWGQDAKRLQAWLAARGNPKIYLRFFGVGKAITYYGITGEPASPEKMQGVGKGTLVISATHLMKPEWRWLREQSRPKERIGQTLFVYDLAEVGGRVKR